MSRNKQMDNVNIIEPGASPDVDSLHTCSSSARPFLKCCPACGRIKALAEFYKDRNRKDGTQSRCKECDGVRYASYDRAYRSAHREEQTGYNRAYYAAHRHTAEHKARIATWCRSEKGRETRRFHRHRREELKTGSTPPERLLTREQWDIVLARSKGRCYWCGKKCKPTMDHVIPLIKGGLHTAENVVVACLKCNFKKHVKIVTLF